MIVDVTDPRNPVEKALIPSPAVGQSQMVRMCRGSDLTGNPSDTNVYLLRNVQGGPAATQGYEVWNVTNVNAPTIASTYYGVRSSHKPWWECNTGVAYLVGSKSEAVEANRWRGSQSMVIVDWKVPTTPIYLRTYGLPGGQPGTSGPTVPSLTGRSRRTSIAMRPAPPGRGPGRRHREPTVSGLRRR